MEVGVTGEVETGAREVGATGEAETGAREVGVTGEAETGAREVGVTGEAETGATELGATDAGASVFGRKVAAGQYSGRAGASSACKTKEVRIRANLRIRTGTLDTYKHNPTNLIPNLKDWSICSAICVVHNK